MKCATGIGVDVFDVCRMERVFREGHGLAGDFLTPDELADAQVQRNAARLLAGRFAAKEAILKALAVDDELGMAWHDVQLRVCDATLPDNPAVVLHGRLKTLADRKGVTRILVSISHTRTVAAAVAILEVAPSDTALIQEQNHGRPASDNP